MYSHNGNLTSHSHLLAALVFLVSSVDPGLVGFLSYIGPYKRNLGPDPSRCIAPFKDLWENSGNVSFHLLLLRL